MSTQEFWGLVGFIGLLTQLGGAVVLAALFWVLRRFATRRAYFRMWSEAWLALLGALAALVLRYNILPSLESLTISESSVEVRTLYFLYQFCKLLFLALLVAGARTYAVGLRSRSAFYSYALAVAGGYTLVSVGFTVGLDEVMTWQSPVAALAYGYGAYLLLRLGSTRRTVGTTATGTVLAASAVLWMLYFLAFGWDYVFGLGPTSPIASIAALNSFTDTLLQTLLAFGMVVMLMEDASREAGTAHAELAVAHDQHRRASIYDPLTGALNRRAFADGIGLEIAKGTYGAVMALDLENLDAVSTAHGRAAGDEQLRYLAEILQRGTRPTDRVYRWSDGCFLVVMAGAKAQDATARLQSLIADANTMVAGSERTDRHELQVRLGAADYSTPESFSAAVTASLRAATGMSEPSPTEPARSSRAMPGDGDGSSRWRV